MARRVTGPTEQLQAVAGDPDGSNMVFELRPMYTFPGGTYNTGGCYNQSNINGNTLSISGGPCRTYWNLFLSNWDPDGDRNPPLRGWQVWVNDQMGLTSGSGAPLTRCTDQICSNSGQCAAAFGETGSVCNSITPGHCNYQWINKTPSRTDAFRPDLPFPDCGDPIWEVGFLLPYRTMFLGTVEPEPCPLQDPHTRVYGGTYCINVPADAAGEYTLPFGTIDDLGGPATFAADPNDVYFVNITLTPGVLALPLPCGDTFCLEADEETPGTCPADCMTLADFSEFQNCFGQPRPISPSCEPFDLHPSGNITSADYAHFVDHNFVGP